MTKMLERKPMYYHGAVIPLERAKWIYRNTIVMAVKPEHFDATKGVHEHPDGIVLVNDKGDWRYCPHRWGMVIGSGDRLVTLEHSVFVDIKRIVEYEDHHNAKAE
jgi:hypothetical protein